MALPVINIAVAGKATADASTALIREVLSPITKELRGITESLKSPIQTITSTLNAPPIVTQSMDFLRTVSGGIIGSVSRRQDEVEQSRNAQKEMNILDVSADAVEESSDYTQESVSLMEEYFPEFLSKLDALILLDKPDAADRLREIENAREAARARRNGFGTPNGKIVKPAEDEGISDFLKGFFFDRLLGMKFFKSLGAAITGMFSTILNPAWWAKKMFSAIGPILKGGFFISLFTGLMNSIKETLEYFLVGDHEKSFVGGLIRFVSAFLEGATFGWLDSDQLVESINDTIATLSEWWSGAWPKIKSYLTEFGSIVMEGLTKTFNYVVTSVRDWFNTIKFDEMFLGLTKLMTKMKSFVGDMLIASFDLLVGAIQWMKEKVNYQEYKENLLDAISYPIDAIVDIFRTVTSYITGIIADLKIGVKKYLLSTIEDSRILNALNSVTGAVDIESLRREIEQEEVDRQRLQAVGGLTNTLIPEAITRSVLRRNEEMRPAIGQTTVAPIITTNTQNNRSDSSVVYDYGRNPEPINDNPSAIEAK